MRTEEGEASSMMMDPWSIFLYGMKAPMTREKYRARLAKFFDYLVLRHGHISCSANKTWTIFTKVYVNNEIITIDEGSIETKRGRWERATTSKISRCHICGEFFQSKKELKDHKDRNHRIINSKIIRKKVPIDRDRG